MEPDAKVKDVQRWVEEEYGAGFKVVDIGDGMWSIEGCPFDAPGAKPSLAAMDRDLASSLFD